MNKGGLSRTDNRMPALGICSIANSRAPGGRGQKRPCDRANMIDYLPCRCRSYSQIMSKISSRHRIVERQATVYRLFNRQHPVPQVTTSVSLPTAHCSFCGSDGGLLLKRDYASGFRVSANPDPESFLGNSFNGPGRARA